jgi:hypothetical protein
MLVLSEKEIPASRKSAISLMHLRDNQYGVPFLSSSQGVKNV